MLNKRFLLISGVLLFIGLASIGIYYLNRQPAQVQTEPNIRQDGTDSSQPSATAPPEQQGEEGGSPFLANLNILSDVYSDVQYFYINQVVMEYANNQLNKSSGLAIDPVSFGKRSDGTYGFTVTDADNNKLFYVVVTKNEDGGITVQEFK